ncbi:MAG: carboxypeptidase regulatory-like domain-containing protein [Bryobacteraceae bacterium]|nr:carboxypeptidase regulatory-like domain-containing protein [Bryobacteraceae bacterium]
MFLRILTLLLATFSLLNGQAMDGNITGTVTDSSGAALKGAALELVNAATGVKFSTLSGEAGSYRFINVLPGRYQLTASLTGFQSSGVQNLAIELNKTSTVNLTLTVGQVSTSVEVTDAAAAIDTTTATVGNTFTGMQAIQLPSSGTGTLGVINLALLNAGVTSSGGLGYGTGPSVGGQRPTNNNFMIEGVDNNNRSVTGPLVNVSNEAVAEFSVQQNQFSVEFGHSTGGQFNTVVKSGSNDLHGSLYDYLQNRKLNAIDEQFLRQGITTNPRSDQNRLGATLGGPVLKNKWFYFGNFEYLPSGAAATNATVVSVPTAAGISLLDAIPGLSKRNLDIFKREVPAASAATGAVSVLGQRIPIGQLRVSAPAFTNDYRAVISSDYNLSSRDQFRARYFYFKQDGIDSTPNLPQFFTPTKSIGHVASFTHLHTFLPNLTNELRAAYNRRVDDRVVGPQQFPGLDAFPNLVLLELGLTVGPNQSYPQSSRSNMYQLVENLNWIKGRHTLKFGYDGRKLNSSNFFVQRARGEYQYNTLERYLQDLMPNQAERSVGGFPFIGNLLSHYLYANDEIRLRRNLTLNLGLRYEYVGVPTGSQQQNLNALSSVPGLLDIRAPRAGKKDFAPRVGLAWSPGRDGKTSVRAGFGLGYDQVYQNLGSNSLPPQFSTTINSHIGNPNGTNFLGSGGTPGVAVPITDPAVARARTAAFVPDQQRPYSIQWNFGVQRVLWNDYTVEARYLGSRGIHLPFQLQTNRRAGLPAGQSLPVFLQRPTVAELDRLTLTRESLAIGVHPLNTAGFTSTITSFTPRGNSTYHGLATQVTKRYSRNLTVNGAYTWSKNIDDSTAALNSTVLTPRRPYDFESLRQERANSALDRRHRLSLAWVYDTPWMKNHKNWAVRNVAGNWAFSGSYIAETGAWGTPRSGVDVNFNGDNAADRTYINTAGDANTGSASTALLNSAGRTVAYLATNPNARYIAVGPGGTVNAGRNTLRLPGINNFDVAFAKRITVKEGKLFELRAELYNAINHAQFTPGYPSAGNVRARSSAAAQNLLFPQNALFNRPDLAFQSNARTIQMVARFQF